MNIGNGLIVGPLFSLECTVSYERKLTTNCLEEVILYVGRTPICFKVTTSVPSVIAILNFVLMNSEPLESVVTVSDLWLQNPSRFNIPNCF